MMQQSRTQQLGQELVREFCLHWLLEQGTLAKNERMRLDLLACPIVSSRCPVAMRHCEGCGQPK